MRIWRALFTNLCGCRFHALSRAPAVLMQSPATPKPTRPDWYLSSEREIHHTEAPAKPAVRKGNRAVPPGDRKKTGLREVGGETADFLRVFAN